MSIIKSRAAVSKVGGNLIDICGMPTGHQFLNAGALLPQKRLFLFSSRYISRA
jgi:hypothetical protein